ncbi:hypothetical protein [Rhodoblastus sp.]|uniref:hypothetical protein n=1 Tax=Rhodoblastus sp. TaxID=1962975 RepID=UPI003F9C4F83
MRGSAVDKIALFCAVVAVISILGAHGMDMLVKSGNLPRIAFIRGDGHSDIDYSATGSIPDRAGRTRLNPCGQSDGDR